MGLRLKFNLVLLAVCLLGLGVFEVAISDTIGIAHPGQVPLVLEAVLAQVPARGPRELPVARHVAGIGHPRQPEVGRVSQDRGEHDARASLTRSSELDLEGRQIHNGHNQY